MTKKYPTMRETFEEVISSSPYEKDVSRYSLDDTRNEWPGNYRDINVALAWDVLCDVVFRGTEIGADGQPDPAAAEYCAAICERLSKDYGGVSAGPLATDFGKALYQAMAAGASNCAAAIRGDEGPSLDGEPRHEP